MSSRASRPTSRAIRLRLGQILINFCSNAVKFTETGEIWVQVRVLEDRDDSQLVAFSVTDTGIGMTQDQVDRLFQAFEQADASTTRRYGGTGLGLAISKQLTELMGGSVEVESEPGKGSVFRFTARLGKSTAAPRPRLLQSDLRGRRVLVIDDNSHARTVLANMLTNMTFTADEAASGEEALECCARRDNPASATRSRSSTGRCPASTASRPANACSRWVMVQSRPIW